MYISNEIEAIINNLSLVNKLLKIHYITPFSTEKNIGKEYNSRIAELPEDAWICLRDGDTMFMRPNWGQQIEAIIQANEEKYKLISCVTNRLRATHQLYNQTFSFDGEISNHIKIANQLHFDYYDMVEPATTVAGVCLIFHKSTWEEFRFNENSIRFDTEFCTAIRRKYGAVIGIAKGLYLFHLYRWGQENPTSYIKHLTHES